MVLAPLLVTGVAVRPGDSPAPDTVVASSSADMTAKIWRVPSARDGQAEGMDGEAGPGGSRGGGPSAPTLAE